MKKQNQTEMPPMPNAKGESSLDSPSISSETISEPQEPEIVSAELAGDIIALPFEVWAQFEPDEVREAILLSQKTKDFLGGPVSRILTKHGLGEIAKDEILVITILSLHTFSAMRAVKKVKSIHAEEKKED